MLKLRASLMPNRRAHTSSNCAAVVHELQGTKQYFPSSMETRTARGLPRLQHSSSAKEGSSRRLPRSQMSGIACMHSSAYFCTSGAGWVLKASVQWAMRESRSMGPGGKLPRHVRHSCHPSTHDSTDGLRVVCFTSWQYTSLRSVSVDCRQIVNSLRLWSELFLFELRSPMNPVTLRKHWIASPTNSLSPKRLKLVFGTSAFHPNSFSVVVRLENRPLRSKLKLLSA
mmetsp:Transcript_19614/g.40312  ORF Transcript_19614/g.40312 Transcript_19614/m.40312 type:complete len:227 (-) Transcript_19614:870-1550(-)